MNLFWVSALSVLLSLYKSAQYNKKLFTHHFQVRPESGTFEIKAISKAMGKKTVLYQQGVGAGAGFRTDVGVRCSAAVRGRPEKVLMEEMGLVSETLLLSKKLLITGVLLVSEKVGNFREF